MVSSTTTPTTKDQRSVSFKTKVLVRRIMHLSDYTKQEVGACWYDRADMERIKKHAKYTLKQFRLQKVGVECSEFDSLFEDDKLCLRGLEGYMEREMIRKLRRRYESIDIVLALQNQQYDHNSSVVNAETIARAYARATETSNRIARGWGIVYEHELGLTLIGDNYSNVLDYRPSSICSPQSRLAVIKESRKLLVWTICRNAMNHAK
ncbi:hypothetical protein IV203_034882 [Nitzschia inconspicua]|uniref:Uncharacterized protein n=1 Tax=Nitzschia inconspicua TaxID=303405 RepID=A0A9K3LDM9_9STRA|nr:hypothetical protein IV203_034882 [Nitzschia inconspicua]